MPRIKDPIWSFFQAVTILGSARVKCNSCRCDVAPLVERMKRHRNNVCTERKSSASTSHASRKYFDEVYQTEKKTVINSDKNSCVTLIVDGWSSVTNEPVLGVFFCRRTKLFSQYN